MATIWILRVNYMRNYNTKYINDKNLDKLV